MTYSATYEISPMNIQLNVEHRTCVLADLVQKALNSFLEFIKNYGLSIKASKITILNI